MYKVRNICITAAIAVFVSMAIFGAFMPEAWYADGNIGNRMQGASLSHVFGTNILGQDIFYNIVRGTYNVAKIVGGSVAIGCVIGGGIGLYAPRFPKSVLSIVQGAMDMVFAFPMVLLALVLMGRYGGGAAVAVIALGVFFIPVFYRIMVGAVSPLWTADFVTAARLNKQTTCAIGYKHILPNAIPIVAANISVQCGIAILAESALGYLGLSTSAPEPTWGSMIVDAQKVLLIKPSLALPVGGVVAAFVILAFALNTPHNPPTHLSIKDTRQ